MITLEILNVDVLHPAFKLYQINHNNLHLLALGIRHMNLKMMECKSLEVVAKVCEHYNGDSQVRPGEAGTRGNLSK